MITVKISTVPVGGGDTTKTVRQRQRDALKNVRTQVNEFAKQHLKAGAWRDHRHGVMVTETSHSSQALVIMTVGELSAKMFAARQDGSDFMKKKLEDFLES